MRFNFSLPVIGIKDECKIGLKKTTLKHAPSFLGHRAVPAAPAAPVITYLPPLLPATTLKRKPSQKIGELMNRFEGAGSSTELAGEASQVQWPLTDSQMGMTGLLLTSLVFPAGTVLITIHPTHIDAEESMGRFYCLVKSLKSGDWLTIGAGDLLLTKTKDSGKARVVFFYKDDPLKARINSWLHPLVAVERNPATPKTVILILPVKSDQTATYSVQLKTPEEAETLYSLVGKLKRNGVAEELGEELQAEIRRQLEEDTPSLAPSTYMGKPPIAPQSISGQRRRSSSSSFTAPVFASPVISSTPSSSEGLKRSTTQSSISSVASVASIETQTSTADVEDAPQEEQAPIEIAPFTQPTAETHQTPGSQSPVSQLQQKVEKSEKRKKPKKITSMKKSKSATSLPSEAASLPSEAASMSLEDVKATLEIPEGPLKNFVELLWQENKLLKELVTKQEKVGPKDPKTTKQTNKQTNKQNLFFFFFFF